ncbi:MAG: hypothetical protein WD512_09175 [Candidatus Paceibacterota bacterium]
MKIHIKSSYKFHEDDTVSANFKGTNYVGTILEADFSDEQGMYWLSFDDYEKTSSSDDPNSYELLDWMESTFKGRDLRLIRSATRWEDIDSNLDLVNTEFFNYSGASWDVRAAKRTIYEKPRQTIQFQVKTAEYYIRSGSIATSDRAGVVPDLTIPIILISSENADGSSGYFPIDGWHRIRRALQMDIATLPAYALTIEESREIME